MAEGKEPLNIQIREATDADTPTLARVMTEANPRQPFTPQALAHEFGQLTGDLYLGRWLAFVDEQPAGAALLLQFAGNYHPDRYHAELLVLPQFRRQGVGKALAALLETHLQARGAQEVTAGAYEDEPHALNFLEEHGFKEAMRFWENVLNVPDFDFTPWQQALKLPDGLRLVTLAQLQDEIEQDAAARAYYDVWAQVRQDVPRSSAAASVPFEDFQRRRYENPNFYPQGVFFAVTKGGEIVALSELERIDDQPENLHNGITGTRREWRGQGIALALKLAGIRLAQAQGFQRIKTSNATTNAPMLSINTKLGFKPEPAMIEFIWGGIQ